MDRTLVSQEYELEYIAKKHGTTVERVREVMRRSGSRSRRELEEALESAHRLPQKSEHPAE